MERLLILGLLCSIIMLLSKNRKIIPMGAGGVVSGMIGILSLYCFPLPGECVPMIFIVTSIGVEYYYDRGILKKLFPFYLSSLICGGAVESVGEMWGTWSYGSVHELLWVIMCGYFSVFYIGWKSMQIIGGIYDR